MPSITLTDSFGFSISATDGGGNGNFFNRLLTDAEFVCETANLKTAGLLPLNENPEPNLPFTFGAKGSASIGAQGIASLTIDAGCTAKLSCSKGDQCSGVVQPFNETWPDGGAGKAAGYLSLDLSANVDAGVTGTVENFTFGLTEGKQVSFGNSRCFQQLASTKLADATRELLTSFTVVSDLADLNSLPAQSIFSVSGKGSLKFSASYGYTFYSNPLTSFDIPIEGTIAVKATGKAVIDFTFTVDAGFKVSVFKQSDGIARLLVGRSQDEHFTESVEVKAQVCATTAKGTDLLAKLLSAISPKPEDEMAKMNAKFSGDEKDAIDDALKSAIENNFELAAKAELEQALGNEILFLYELDLNALSKSAEGNTALQNALKGDFSGLSQVAVDKQSGVTELQTITTNTKTSTRRLTVHLLNIFQAGSISALITKESVKATPGGDLVITDTDTARRIGFTSIFGKFEGLRNLLFTSAMITSAYKGTNTQLSYPELRCELVHFHYDQKAGADEVQTDIEQLEALRLVSNEEAAAAAPKLRNATPAPLTINIRLTLTAGDCERLFLDADQKPRTSDAYESVAKSAMYMLICHNTSLQDVCGLLTTNELALWNKLKASDTPNDVMVALGDTDDSRAQRYFTEIARIKWWTEHMSALANCVAAFRNAGANLKPNSADFQKLQKALNAEAKSVSSLSQDYFDLPWGIQAMSQLLGFSPQPEVTFVSQPFSIQVAAPEPTTAAASAP